MPLFDTELTGSIPPEVGNLSSLAGLPLFDNELTGSIPPEVGNLSNLAALLLFDNELTGSIPSKVGNLSHLPRCRCTTMSSPAASRRTLVSDLGKRSLPATLTDLHLDLY